MTRSSLIIGVAAFAAALFAIFYFNPGGRESAPVLEGVESVPPEIPKARNDDGPPILRLPSSEPDDEGEAEVEDPGTPSQLWYEDQALLEAAMAEYPDQLEAVKARVESYAQKSDGAEMIRRSVAHGYFLFDSEEFPITAEDIAAAEQLDQVDLANALNELAGNRKRVGRWVDELDEGRQGGILKSMNSDPMSYPPSLLMQVYTGTARVDLDPDFILDARELYLREWPRLYDARREKSIGISATSQTLEVVGVDPAQIGQTFKQFDRLSPEVAAGDAQEEAIEQEFLIEFQALVQKYYL